MRTALYVLWVLVRALGLLAWRAALVTAFSALIIGLIWLGAQHVDMQRVLLWFFAFVVVFVVLLQMLSLAIKDDDRKRKTNGEWRKD